MSGPAFLDGAVGIALPARPSVDDDPVGAWRTQTEAVQALLDDADIQTQLVAFSGRTP